MTNLFKDYSDYLKDNPKGYWFKKKLYGWGWTPVTWQGWLCVIAYIGILAILSFTVRENTKLSEALLTFFLPLFLLTAGLIFIAYKKGEKPGWQWGPPKNK